MPPRRARGQPLHPIYPLSGEFLNRMMEGGVIERVRVGVDNGGFTYVF
jgi:hypothetical protein